jgi:hypothetical protein
MESQAMRSSPANSCNAMGFAVAVAGEQLSMDGDDTGVRWWLM